MNISEQLFGQSKRCKSFTGRNNAVTFEFEDGTTKTIQLPADQIIFLGQGAFDLGYLFDTYWDFQKEPYCPILFEEFKWGLINKEFEIVTSCWYDSIGDLYNGCCSRLPPYANHFYWESDRCKVCKNGEESYLYKSELEKRAKTYKDIIGSWSSFSMQEMIHTCQMLVPADHKYRPWRHPEVNHGRGVLRTDDGLNCYMAAYGDGHVAKANKAISLLWPDTFTEPFEVWDWGCGQGVGTLCLIEHLRERNLLNNLKRITLVEPSMVAIDRAMLNISQCAHPDTRIIKICKGLPANRQLPFECVEEILVSQPTVVHLFSNILDITTIDLKALAELVASKGHKHVVSCFGPADCREDRINAFCGYFNKNAACFLPPFSENDFYYSRKYQGHMFGCYIRNFSFSLDSGIPILIPYKFYAPKQFLAAYQSDILGEIDDRKISAQETAFEVLAPFDIGANVYDDVHPIWAVINNLIVRGLPTKASPWIEKTIGEAFHLSHLDEESLEYGCLCYTIEETDKNSSPEEVATLIREVPLAVARIQKTVVEAVLTGHLPIDSTKWKVLVKEADVPCAAIAFEDMSIMFNHLAAASRDYDGLRFPDVELTIINAEHQASPLHLGKDVFAKSNAAIQGEEYDLVIDFSLHETTKPLEVEFSEFKAKNNCYFNVRSSESVYAERVIYTTDRIVYKPLTKLNAQGTHDVIEENAQHLRYFIQLLFRKTDFREGQLPIISRALQLKSVIGLLPTGGGKSLTYQIAALLQPGVTIVVDPLMSLMKDQYDGLIKNGIDFCTYINSKVENKAERESLLKDSKILFVFLSPERLSVYRFRDSLRAMADNHIYFAYGVIDEVHCVSEWGHDFRFSYLHLGRNMYKYVLPKQTEDPSLNHITLLGLTGV